MIIEKEIGKGHYVLRQERHRIMGPKGKKGKTKRASKTILERIKTRKDFLSCN